MNVGQGDRTRDQTYYRMTWTLQNPHAKVKNGEGAPLTSYTCVVRTSQQKTLSISTNPAKFKLLLARVPGAVPNACSAYLRQSFLAVILHASRHHVV